MLKERSRAINIATFLVDIGLVVVAFVAAHWLRDFLLPWLAVGAFPTNLYPLSAYLPLLPLALGVWGVFLLSSQQYRSHRTVPLLEDAWSILRASGAAAVLFTLLLYTLRLDERVLESDRVSRAWLLLFGALACLLLLGEKLLVRSISHYVRTRGFNFRTLLIVGTSPGARSIARSIEGHAHWGINLLGFVEADGEPIGLVDGYPVLGSVGDLPSLVREEVIDDIVFAVSRTQLGQMEDVFLALEEQGIRTMLALNFFPHAKAKVRLSEFDGIPFLTFFTGPGNPLLLLAKRSIDVAVSGLLLLFGWPLVLALGLAIKISSRGSVLFSQTRCGLNGRRFTLYKFRTMVEGAEERMHEVEHLNEMDGPVFKVARDPRVTPVGRLLRKFSLDELPQLWNVLRGDMSLVGPRPPIPEEVAQYERWQRRRLSMKPGLTCLWQVNGRNDVDFSSWMALDLEYIDTWSLGLDMRILLKTIPVVLSGRGAS
jgi:exopolysaccharide biosynthesis polyprenyl glycosylphosphotransferase